MDNPITFLLRREVWQLFCTLTYESPVPGLIGRKKMLLAWLRKLAKLRGVEFESLLWVAREELGELNGRCHYHVLISGLPPSKVTISGNFILMDTWEKLGGGIARVYKYRPQLSGVDYVMKGLEDLGKGYRGAGAEAYEVGKFSAAEADLGLIPARALWRKWRNALEPNRRHRKAREMRAHHRDRSTKGAEPKTWGPAQFPHPADHSGSRLHV